MDEVELLFEELVKGLQGIGPFRSTPTSSGDLSTLAINHRKFLERYVSLRNPGAIFRNMEGTVDGTLVTSLKRVGRAGISTYLKDYEPIPLLDGHTFFTPNSKYDEGEILHSYFIPSLTPDRQKFVYGHTAEGKSGTPMRLYNLVPTVLLALGPERKSEISRTCMGMLKYFSTLWGEKGDDECDDPPYGNIRVTVDSMSPKKIYTCVNMMYHMSNFKDDVVPYLKGKGIDMVLMVREYLSIMCKSPIGHALGTKGAIGFAYMHASAMAGSGTYVVLSRSDEWDRYDKFESPKVSPNAPFWLEMYGDMHREYVKELRLMGHTQLAKIVLLAPYIPHGAISIRFAEWISGIRAVTGYCGTNQNVTFKDIFDPIKDSTEYKDIGFPETYSKDASGQYNMPSVPFLREIMSTTYKHLLDIDSRIRLLAWPEFVKAIPRYLTANSAGIGKIKIIGKIDGEDIEIGTTSKSMIYPLSPSTFKPLESGVTMSNVDVQYPPFSVDNPGRMAARRVVGKATRAVQMQPMKPYIIEAFMYGPLYRYFMRKPDPKTYTFPGSTVMATQQGLAIDPNCMTLGTETGNPFYDHRDAFIDTGLAAFSSDSNMVVLYAGDYSAYDETEMSRNVRIPFRDGIIDAFKGVSNIGPFSSIDVVMRILAPCEPAAYALPNGEIVYLDGVRSGEYATMLINNAQNASVCAAVIQRVHGLGVGTFTDLKVQGDDVRARVEISPSVIQPRFTNSNDDEILAADCMGVHNVTAFAKIAAKTICKCGQETNIQKGIIATNISDYLKVRVIAGRLSPNNYAQLFGSESVGMSDSPQSFMSGQLQKGDLVVARGADPDTVFRFGLLLFLLRCSYRVGIRGTDPNYSHIYYPPISMWFTPTSMGGLGRAPFTYPFPGDPALSLWMTKDETILNYVRERSSSLKARASRDYTKIISGLIMNASTRSDFKVTANIRPQTIPVSDLMKPFSKGVSELSSGLDVGAINRSEAAYSYLQSKGIKLVPSKMLYKNSPARQIENVIASNSSVMEFSYNKSKTISSDSFVGAKMPSFSDTEIWLSSMTHVVSEAPIVSCDPEGPLCFLHPKSMSNMSHMGWGSTSSETQKNIASIVNMIKTDPLFPRDITDEGIMRLLFSPEISENANVLPAVLLSIGCTEDTVARIVATFSDTSVNTILLQYISGTFTLNTPMFQPLNRSNKSVSRYITDVSQSRTTRTALPAFVSYWNFLTYAKGSPVHIHYEQTERSIQLSTKVEPLTVIPFTPILEAERMRSETRAPVNTPFM